VKLSHAISKLRERKHGRLWFGHADNERWSITDPTDPELDAAMQRLRPYGVLFVDGKAQWPERTPEEKQRDTDLYRVLMVVEEYRHLTTYPLGVEHCIRQLRAIWRGLR